MLNAVPNHTAEAFYFPNTPTTGTHHPAPAPIGTHTASTDPSLTSAGRSYSSPTAGDSAPHGAVRAAVPKPNRSRACEPCRKKKLRCDTMRPACSSCQARRSVDQCVYMGAPPKPYNRKVTKEVRALEDRVKALERLVTGPTLSMVLGVKADDERSGIDHIPGVTDRVGGVPPTASLAPGQTLAATIDMMGPVAPRDPSPFAIPGSHSPPASSLPQPPPTLRELLAADGVHDPDPDALAESFFALEMARFPLAMVHRATFMHHQHDRILPILRYAVLGCGARLHPACLNGSEMLARSEALFGRARGMIAQFIDEPHVQAVQALLIMVMCSAATCRTSAATMYLSLMSRMALILKLDTDPDRLPQLPNHRPLTWIETETMRRTWWAAYVLDRLIAGITQRPPHLAECSPEAVRFPSADAVWEALEPVDQLPADLVLRASGKESWMRWFWGIADLFYRVVGFARGAGGVHGPGGGEGGEQGEGVYWEDSFAKMEDELARWFESLPRELRERMVSMDDNTRFSDRFGAEEELPWIAVVVQMTYYGCLCILHRPRLILALSAQGLAAASRPASGLAIDLSPSPIKDESVTPPPPHGGVPMTRASNGGPSSSPHGGAAKLKDAMTTVVATTAQLSILDLGKHVLGSRILAAARREAAVAVEMVAGMAAAGGTPRVVDSGVVGLDGVVHSRASVMGLGDGAVGDGSSPAVASAFGACLPVSPARLAFSLHQGQAAAQAIARLVALVRRVNPTCFNLSSYAGMAIIESTLILMLLVTRGVEADEVGALVTAARCRAGIDGNMAVLEELAKNFYMFKHSLEGIGAMVASIPGVEELLARVEVRRAEMGVGGAWPDVTPPPPAVVGMGQGVAPTVLQPAQAFAMQDAWPAALFDSVPLFATQEDVLAMQRSLSLPAGFLDALTAPVQAGGDGTAAVFGMQAFGVGPGGGGMTTSPAPSSSGSSSVSSGSVSSVSGNLASASVTASTTSSPPGGAVQGDNGDYWRMLLSGGPPLGLPPMQPHHNQQQQQTGGYGKAPVFGHSVGMEGHGHAHGRHRFGYGYAEAAFAGVDGDGDGF
ncbi:hypothetical protein HDU96_005957 [Phlyctochytrium bullatum]|nr:hypothetical protein HDU96_005957 [Phlyctochytrium bullatum]